VWSSGGGKWVKVGGPQATCRRWPQDVDNDNERGTKPLAKSHMVNTTATRTRLGRRQSSGGGKGGKGGKAENGKWEMGQRKSILVRESQLQRLWMCGSNDASVTRQS